MLTTHMNPGIPPTTPPCNAVLVPTQHWTPQTPPPFDPVPGIPNPLHAALPVIAATTMNMLSKNVTTSYTLCYLYNRITMNAMRNREWQKMLEAVVFHTWYNINTNTFQSEDQALDAAAKAVILAYSSFVAVHEPAMRSWLPVSQQEEVKNLAQRWLQFVAEYQKLEQQNRAAATHAAPSAMGLSTHVDPTIWNQPTPGNDAGMATFAPAATWGAPESNQPKQASVGFYDQPVQEVRPGKREMFVPGASPESQRPEAPVVKEPPKASFLSTVTHISQQGVTQAPMNHAQQATADEWEPTPYQPYHPAYRTGDQAIYEYHNDANQIRRVIAIINQEAEMDRSQHAFSSNASYAAFYGTPHEAPEMKIQEALSATAKAIMEGDVGENPEATELYRALGVIDNEPVEIDTQTSLRGLITEARSFRVVAAETAGTFIVASSVAHQIVSKTQHGDLITKLSNAGSLANAAKLLKAELEAVKADPTQNRRGYLDFILGLDRVIRQELMQVIRFRMGVGERFRFDSFMEDEPDVRAVLKDAYGLSYEQAYRQLEASLLHALFSPELVNVMDLNPSEGEAPAGYVTSISPMVTMLLMDISDEQFGLQLPDGAVCEVFQDTFPGLFDFIKSVVANNPGALHHYLVTNDDVVYEVNVGLVGHNKHMVLTRINRAGLGV